ncbi:hypothetical protein BX600DRAFT_518304 [Xylariales sp. PMI_506]|nr:hypothetical protein BX600DRAFT_518304 [Xylariales sp. PMI_506]
MHPFWLLPIFPLRTITQVNGPCGGNATGAWLSDGICIDELTCSEGFNGTTTSGGCPDDANNIKCCLVGLLENANVNPCGGTSYCDWTTNPCGGSWVSGFCPGPSGYKCCKEN